MASRRSKPTNVQRKGETQRSGLTFRPLTPSLMDEFGIVVRGSWGVGCWCMAHRLTSAQTQALPGPGSISTRRRAAMTRRARRRPAPGILAFEDNEPVGWIAIARRTEFKPIEASRSTPRVDDEDVWIIPCVAVRKTARGRGVAVELIRAAVAYAVEHGAPAVEAYPRAGDVRTKDDNAYIGTEPLFRRAGFRVIRGRLKDIPSNWVQRVTMRITR